MSKELMFSVSATDCDWSYTKGTGAGGQKKNKTSSAVHCMHRKSGAHGYSEASRSQADNRKDAFQKMINTKEFQSWLKIETMKRTGELQEIERQVEKELTKVKVEVYTDGKWRNWDDITHRDATYGQEDSASDGDKSYQHR